MNDEKVLSGFPNWQERLNRYLNFLEKNSKDYQQAKAEYTKAHTELKKSLENADRLISCINELMLYKLEKAYNQGIADNIMHFLNPANTAASENRYPFDEKIIFLNEKFNCVYTEQKNLLKSVADSAYHSVIKYCTLTDTFIPKMAHYCGFISANSLAYGLFENYTPDTEFCEKYRLWLSSYLEFDPNRI